MVTSSTLGHARLLSKSLGREAVIQEIRWMQQSIATSRHSQGTNRLTLDQMLRRRINGEPLQYILGSQPFGKLDIRVRSPTLIPRPETEEWALRLSKTLKLREKKPISVLDICTGTGCVPLLLCSEWEQGSVQALGVDIADHAVKLATENAALAGFGAFTPSIPGVEDHEVIIPGNTLRVIKADLFSADFAAKLAPHTRYPFSVITCNPPYIPRTTFEALSPSVKYHEDALALIGEAPPLWRHHVGNREGLAFYHRLANLLSDASRLIAPAAIIALEVGNDQAAAVEGILLNETDGIVQKTEVWRDAWGIPRLVLGQTQ